MSTFEDMCTFGDIKDLVMCIWQGYYKEGYRVPMPLVLSWRDHAEVDMGLYRLMCYYYKSLEDLEDDIYWVFTELL